MTVQVHFLPDDVKTTAEVGESLLKVADRAGVLIPTGCLMGSCHACEVEMNNEDVRSCITAIPPGDELITVHLFSDPTW
ncbi:2Fe-2S iron-sulfur cluster binding domain-containing protein [filamentous cyanobacterium LEGE 11480]|uniref:2Fe-2S iron-sulfur cluster binding domain-containing protein n=1 Tax=Romeriopsis navalis LEGE 11480 TaxID=2777977 RepID=A0A928VNZ4_9CYAN|nr:(2Fe-2S)-binding protein [Romeriopsis navalis]MBE9031107.1 2Fe-2S iron-sulfur cluster binding domain-containing protein [Romeriopsis navalis LEGE 11480]